MICTIGNHIQSEIIQDIKKAKFYTILADELSDISNKEQLYFRYVLDGNVKEVFADFAEVERITGKVHAETIMNSLARWGLSLSNLRGQCYDGASNMAGARSVCSAIIQQEASMALYHHFAVYRLNLALLSACKIRPCHFLFVVKLLLNYIVGINKSS